MLSRLPLTEFLAFIERLEQRGHQHLRAGRNLAALRAWRAADRLHIRRAL